MANLYHIKLSFLHLSFINGLHNNKIKMISDTVLFFLQSSGICCCCCRGVSAAVCSRVDFLIILNGREVVFADPVQFSSEPDQAKKNWVNITLKIKG